MRVYMILGRSVWVPLRLVTKVPPPVHPETLSRVPQERMNYAQHLQES